MFEWLATKQFLDLLEKLDEQIQIRVKEKIQFLSKQENPLFLAKKLRGYKDLFRFRVGDYRIVFRLSLRTIILLRVKHRSEVYENL